MMGHCRRVPDREPSSKGHNTAGSREQSQRHRSDAGAHLDATSTAGHVPIATRLAAAAVSLLLSTAREVARALHQEGKLCSSSLFKTLQCGMLDSSYWHFPGKVGHLQRLA